MPTFEVALQMSAIECARCGITFGIPKRFEQDRREDHKTFYCPSGCHNYYAQKSEAEKLRDELTRERAKLDQAKADAQWWKDYQASTEQRLDTEQRRLRAHKGVVTKLKKRVANGACPCCHKKFKDLRDHMRAEHPEWDPEKGAEAMAGKA